jgi:glutamate-1-semialdehyde 2,1-aminomutase
LPKRYSKASEIRDTIESTYRRRTPRSAELHAAAQRYLPGGDTRTVTFFTPYPLYMERGQGCRLYDVDGNEYIDFLNNYTSLIHGHAFPPVVEAIAHQAALGTAYAACTENQRQLAELIAGRVASVDQIRFCNSGTEATMNAVRAARAFTGKDKLVKMEGGYHGTHDAVEISVHPALDQAGPANRPHSIPDSLGIPSSVLGDVIVVPFNDQEAMGDLIRKRRDEIAAVLVEPVMGVAGAIPAEWEYLAYLRQVTAENDVLLICDEVMTFRLDWGGAQAIYGIEPDLTALAKIIGGGLPVGAFGGRREIMRLFSPLEGGMSQSGTFNGNPLTMAAGVAAMQALTRERIAHCNALGNRLADGFRAAFEEAEICGQVTGLGSLLNVHFVAGPVRNYRDAALADAELKRLLHLALLNRGVFAARRELFNPSTVMTEAEVDQAVAAFKDALLELKPYIEESSPHLLA